MPADASLVSQWRRRLAYAFRRHGFLGFVSLAAYNLQRLLSRRRAGPDKDSFDERFGTNTASIREIGSLEIAASPNAIYAGRYEASNVEWIAKPLQQIERDLSQTTFIDFGSGKGRALLVAAGYPFKEVIGVEFSRELHDISRENIARFPKSAMRAGSIRSICEDAGSIDLPQTNLVCYFYDPFGPPIMRRVLTRLLAHAKKGFDITIIYVNPRHRTIFEETGQFSILAESETVLLMAARARQS